MLYSVECAFLLYFDLGKLDLVELLVSEIWEKIFCVLEGLNNLKVWPDTCLPKSCASGEWQ